MSTELSTRRVQRVRHELKRRDLQVVRIESPSPNFRSVTFAGESLADFVSSSFDDHVKLMIDAVGALALPAGEGYAWCAGEAGVMAALRRVLVDEKGHDRNAIRAAAYWKRGAVAHHENLE